MKRLPLTVLLASSALVLGSIAAEAQPRGERGGQRGGEVQRTMMMLHAADANRDNAITRAEVESLQAEMFAWMDRNSDGYLDDADKSPVRQRMEAIHAERRAEADAEGRGGPRGHRRGGRGSQENRADANQDGRVSREEFINAGNPLFDRLDADGNDTITSEELDAAVERRENRRFWWRD